MVDPELKEHLEKIEDELVLLRIRTTSVSHYLFRGLMYGAGYIVGTLLIVVIIGWILNVVGIIPAFSREASEFRTTLQNFSRGR